MSTVPMSKFRFFCYLFRSFRAWFSKLSPRLFTLSRWCVNEDVFGNVRFYGDALLVSIGLCCLGDPFRWFFGFLCGEVRSLIFELPINVGFNRCPVTIDWLFFIPFFADFLLFFRVSGILGSWLLFRRWEGGGYLQRR